MLKLYSYFLSALLMVFFLSSNMAYSKSITDEASLPNDLKNTLDTRSFIHIGETTFSVLFWDIYKSKLLTTTGKYPIETEKENLVFDINYLADISSKDLIERTVDQWEHLGLQPEQYQIYLAELKNIWPDIKEGDSLSLLIHQGRSVFYFNQQYIGVINAPEFGQMFIAIWLSEKTSQPNLRRELLGSINNEET